MKKVKWSKAHNPESFDSATERLVLDWSGKLDCIYRMLHWLIAEMIYTDKDVIDEMRLKAVCNQPDITDILEGK